MLTSVASFFFTHTAAAEFYTLSYTTLFRSSGASMSAITLCISDRFRSRDRRRLDRKSTRLNSSHVAISYAVFCLKKKKNDKSLNVRTHDNRDNKSRPVLLHTDLSGKLSVRR